MCSVAIIWQAPLIIYVFFVHKLLFCDMANPLDGFQLSLLRSFMNIDFIAKTCLAKNGPQSMSGPSGMWPIKCYRTQMRSLFSVMLDWMLVYPVTLLFLFIS